MATPNFEFCRLCLRRKRTNTPTHAVESLGLHARVLWVFQIKLYEGDGLPSQMCNTCLDRLSVAQQLKETILSVDTTLRLRGSSFYEQDQSMSMDDGVIPLLAVKMDQENGEEDEKKRSGRKRRRKTLDEEADVQPETDLDEYGLQFTEQQEPPGPVKEEPIVGESTSDTEPLSDFTLKEVDLGEINHNEDYAFHSVLEIKEEQEEEEEEEREGEVTSEPESEERTSPVGGAEYDGREEEEPELVIDEGPDLDEPVSVPVLSLAEEDDAPLDCLGFDAMDDVIPVAISSVFRREEGPFTPANAVPGYESFDLSCSSGASGQRDDDERGGGGDVEDVLPITQVFKSGGRGDNKPSNDGETSGEDSLNDSMNREESGSDFSLQDTMDASRIISVKERHRCERCKRWYVNFVKLSQHRCRARPLKTKKTINYVKCSLCEDVFYKLSDLNEHVRSHRHVESLQCSLCERRFSNKTGLTKHMGLSHKQEAWASQVGRVEGAATDEANEGVVIVDERTPEAAPSERSILKALLAGQRIHLSPTGAHKVT